MARLPFMHMIHSPKINCHQLNSHEINSSVYVNKDCFEHLTKCVWSCWWGCWYHMHLSTRSGIKYIRLRSWCPRRNSTKRKTAIPNTLLHDNSNCRCVATIIELLMVLIFWGVSSFPGHMGMSPSVTWSGPISYSLITKLLLTSVEYTQQAYTISVDMFG